MCVIGRRGEHECVRFFRFFYEGVHAVAVDDASAEFGAFAALKAVGNGRAAELYHFGFHSGSLKHADHLIQRPGGGTVGVAASVYQ